MESWILASFCRQETLGQNWTGNQICQPSQLRPPGSYDSYSLETLRFHGYLPKICYLCTHFNQRILVRGGWPELRGSSWAPRDWQLSMNSCGQSFSLSFMGAEISWSICTTGRWSSWLPDLVRKEDITRVTSTSTKCIHLSGRTQGLGSIHISRPVSELTIWKLHTAFSVKGRMCDRIVA